MEVQIDQFNSLGDNQINARILYREAVDAGLSVQGVSFPSADLVQFLLSEEPSEQQKNDLLAVCDAHEGGDFSPHNLAKFEVSELHVNEGSAVALTLDTGPLEHGDYLLIWYSEFWLDGVLVEAGTKAQARLLVARDGQPEEQKAINQNEGSSIDSFGGITFMSFRDGQSASIKIELSKQEDHDDLMTAKITNCQLFVRKS